MSIELLLWMLSIVKTNGIRSNGYCKTRRTRANVKLITTTLHPCMSVFGRDTFIGNLPAMVLSFVCFSIHRHTRKIITTKKKSLDYFYSAIIVLISQFRNFVGRWILIGTRPITTSEMSGHCAMFYMLFETCVEQQ